MSIQLLIKKIMPVRFSNRKSVFLLPSLPALQGYKRRRYFISTQAPLDNTIVDFWKMATCCKPESRTIVLLCDLVENGKVCEDQK